MHPTTHGQQLTNPFRRLGNQSRLGEGTQHVRDPECAAIGSKRIAPMSRSATARSVPELLFGSIALRLTERTRVRHYEAMERHLAADALQRVNDLEAALEPLGLAADASAEVSRRPLPDRGLGAGQGGPGGPAPHLAGCRSNKGSAPRTARRRAGRHGQSHPEWAVCARPRGSGGVSLAPPTRPFGDTAVRAARSVARTGGPPAGADRRIRRVAAAQSSGGRDTDR